MRLFFWRKDGESAKRKVEKMPEPLADYWEIRVLSRDPHICLKAILEAGEKKDPSALPALIKLVRSMDPIGDEAISAIPLIIKFNRGHPEVIGLVGEIEKRLDPREPSDDLWIFSAITEANPGMFSGLVPLLLKMLENYAKKAETPALKAIALSLGNIGDKSAIKPLERLLESGAGDDELREMVCDSLARLRTKTVYVN